MPRWCYWRVGPRVGRREFDGWAGDGGDLRELRDGAVGKYLIARRLQGSEMGFRNGIVGRAMVVPGSW